MLSKDDIKGVAVMVPTPTKEGAEGWDVADSVDLEETARMVESYIRAGIGVIAACGTTGECAALLWEERGLSSTRSCKWRASEFPSLPERQRWGQKRSYGRCAA
jgi:trans-o-hydroxybenzylidenepyruvate hydratase-aldolase